MFQPNNILVVRPDMLGDCMLITPAIALLREKFRSAKITILARGYTKDVFKNNPDISEIIEDRIAEGRIKSITDFKNYVDFIKSFNFDCSIHFYNELPYAFLALLSGIKKRVGDTSKPLLYPFYSLRGNMRWNDLTLHEVEHTILLLEPLGIKLPDTPPPLRISAEKMTSGNLTVGIHIGTGRGNKAWLPDRYAKVVDYLTEKLNAKVILTGGSKEKPAAEIIMRLCRKKPLNMVSKTTVNELIDLIAQCGIYISVDTGPLHIAAALKVPTVAIFPTKFVKPSEWGPWQTRHVIIRKAIKCSQKCAPRDCPFDDCLKEITAEDVIEGVQTLLSGRGNSTLAEARADWFKKSANIFVNREEIQRELRLSGYHAVEIGSAISATKLSAQMIKEDINIIHWVGHTRPFALTLAKYLAAPRLPIPPVLIYEKARADFSADTLAEFYKRRFKR